MPIDRMLTSTGYHGILYLKEWVNHLRNLKLGIGKIKFMTAEGEVTESGGLQNSIFPINLLPKTGDFTYKLFNNR